MTKVSRLGLVFFGLVSCASLLAQPKELTFVTNVNEDFPYLLGNSEALSLPNPGVSVEIIWILERELGLKIKILRLPWKRALEIELAGGTVDGAFFASYSKEREAFGVYPMKNGAIDTSRAYSLFSYFLYKQKGSPVEFDGTKIKNLQGPIGVARGYSIGPELTARGYLLEETTGPMQGFVMLSNGRINLIAVPHDNANYILETNPDLAKKIESLPTPISSKAYYLMLSRKFVTKSPELAEAIWNTLPKVSQRELGKLYKRYMSQ